ncbi:hypothetical protein EVAR_43896_1 [Eumeta japonica]|uniref:Secreted protein n=1 Tax=Eumeta variegata TaxID=151549 RepID=A0A4C1WRE7_EUMVA|nr:hypothetical protein EVAR_43896_1 [Eumeta japonica]
MWPCRGVRRPLVVICYCVTHYLILSSSPFSSPQSAAECHSLRNAGTDVRFLFGTRQSHANLPGVSPDSSQKLINRSSFRLDTRTRVRSEPWGGAIDRRASAVQVSCRD